MSDDFQDVNFIFVNADEGFDGATQWEEGIAPKGTAHIVGTCPGMLSMRYIPHSTVVDKNGVIFRNGSGVNIEEALRELKANGMQAPQPAE